MIIFLLLVIIAIMLMGSSAFIGAVGVILGSIVGFIALAMLMDAWATWSTVTQFVAVGIPVALLFGGWLWLKSAMAKESAGAVPQVPAMTPKTRTDYVWNIYKRDIETSFSSEARAAAHTARNQDDEQQLNRVCSAEGARLARLRGGGT